MKDYQFKRVEEHGYIITEDGHTMFPEDVKKRLDRLNFLEAEKSAMCEANSNAVLDDVRELIQMIDVIPCICDEAYKGRGLVQPDCPRCNWIEDDIVAKVRAHIG